MTTQKKLENYRLHLQAWREAKKQGYRKVPIPKPEHFSLYTDQEKFMADQIRQKECPND